jgi:hypothetical protein
MKRLRWSVLLLLLLGSVNASFEFRELTEVEEAALKAAAAKSAGISVWLIQGNVMQVQAGDMATVNVVFEPAESSGYCLAPTSLFSSESSDGELLNWSPIEGATIQYQFWFQPCDGADPQAAISLKQYVDTSILERIGTSRDQIVGDGIRLLPPEREYDVPISEHRLVAISIQFDSVHGAVYTLEYLGTSCRSLSIDVVMRPEDIQVLRTAQSVC